MASSEDKTAAARAQIQEFVRNDPKGGWDQAWQADTTPWDLGGVTPAVVSIISSGDIADARTVFVPGCGSGYDVVAFAEGGKRRAVGLDISETALTRARELAREQAGAGSVDFVNADFFAYSPPEPFDVIFDYTFFCALNPSSRPEWARKTASILAPEGTLYTLVFPIGDYEGGPPYAVSIRAYEDVLAPLGFSYEEVSAASHPSRKEREVLLKWNMAPTPKF